MTKKCKQRQKNDKEEKKVIMTKKDKRNKKEKKVRKENTKKAEEIKEKEEEDKIEKLLEKICNEECKDGVETFTENGEKVDPFDDEAPLYYGNFGFKVDVDTGRILDWPDSKLYVKVNMRVMDTGFYDYYDKDNNKIYEEEGYAPNFLEISSKYCEDICFDTDANGFILGWKEKNVKEQIIEHLREYLLGEFDFN